MSDTQPEVGASGTFEAGPAATIAGKEHQLVFVRADDPMDAATMRYHSLKHALDTVLADAKFSVYMKGDESGEAETPLSDRALAIAERYFAYMKDGSR